MYVNAEKPNLQFCYHMVRVLHKLFSSMPSVTLAILPAKFKSLPFLFCRAVSLLWKLASNMMSRENSNLSQELEVHTGTQTIHNFMAVGVKEARAA